MGSLRIGEDRGLRMLSIDTITNIEVI